MTASFGATVPLSGWGWTESDRQPNITVASVRVLLLTSKSQGRQPPAAMVLHTARDEEVFLQRLLFPPRAAKTVPIELFLQPL